MCPDWWSNNLLNWCKVFIVTRYLIPGQLFCKQGMWCSAPYFRTIVLTVWFPSALCIASGIMDCRGMLVTITHGRVVHQLPIVNSHGLETWWVQNMESSFREIIMLTHYFYLQRDNLTGNCWGNEHKTLISGQCKLILLSSVKN